MGPAERGAGADAADVLIAGVDGSEGSAHALGWAIEEARLRGSAVRAVHAWLPPLLTEIGNILVDEDISGYEAHAREVVASMVPSSSDVHVEGRAVQGEAPVALLDELDRDGTMLVMGSRGRGGFKSLLLGSVSEQCAAEASKPVVVVPPGAPLPRSAAPSGSEADVGDVVVGVDGSDGSVLALSWALEEAALRGAKLAVVNGWWNAYWYPSLGITSVPYAVADFQAVSRDMLDETLDAALSSTSLRPPEIEKLAVGEPPVAALLERSEGAGLLVVGTRGRRALASAVLGSVSRQCLQHAGCAVAVVPSGGG